MKPRHLQISRLAALVVGCYGTVTALATPITPPAITSYAGDPGTLGDPASWRTPEFLRDWGMRAIGAEYAYAAGFAGGGVSVGIVDSGYRETASEFSATPSTPLRFHSVTASGGTTGPTPGFWNGTYNDSHGTHVSGTVGANRDGLNVTGNMQGVAFNATIYEGNSHKTDGALYGQLTGASATNTPDKDYISNVYRAVASAGTSDQPVRIITSSWGSAPSADNYNAVTGANSLTSGWAFLAGANPTGPFTSWIQGAIDVAESGSAIIQFTAGNGGFKNPTPRGAATYFLPQLEGTWYTTSAITTVGQTFNADGSINVPGTQTFNQCGVAKWACVTAPGSNINSVHVNADGSVTYSSLSGTSMAGPHSAAALALIMERFPYMTNEQALYTMFTTAVQNATVNNSAGVAVANATAGQRVVAPDDRNGWGTVNLKNAMLGPGQFLGVENINTKGYDDTWSLDISDAAIKQRQVEDTAEAATWNATKIANGWVGLTAPPAGSTADQILAFDTGMAREAARNSRVYQGSLIKGGDGVLTLTGNNSFTGGVTVNGGGLLAASRHALGLGNVSVQGGSLFIRGAGGTPVEITGNLAMGSAGTLDLGFNFGSAADPLDVDGNALLDGTLIVELLGTNGPLVSGTYDLFDVTGSIDGSFDNLLIYGADHVMGKIITTNGVVQLALVVPEPDVLLLFAPALAMMWFYRRRKKQ
jgi:subtilase-type serine protease